jgi:hypothetical protein
VRVDEDAADRDRKRTKSHKEWWVYINSMVNKYEFSLFKIINSTIRRLRWCTKFIAAWPPFHSCLKLPLPPIQWKSMQCQLQPDMKNLDIIRTFVRWLRYVSHEHVSKTISKSKRLIRPVKYSLIPNVGIQSHNINQAWPQFMIVSVEITPPRHSKSSHKLEERRSQQHQQKKNRSNDNF